MGWKTGPFDNCVKYLNAFAKKGEYCFHILPEMYYALR